MKSARRASGASCASVNAACGVRFSRARSDVTRLNQLEVAAVPCALTRDLRSYRRRRLRRARQQRCSIANQRNASVGERPLGFAQRRECQRGPLQEHGVLLTGGHAADIVLVLIALRLRLGGGRRLMRGVVRGAGDARASVLQHAVLRTQMVRNEHEMQGRKGLRPQQQQRGRDQKDVARGLA